VLAGSPGGCQVGDVLETNALQVRQALYSNDFDASVAGGLVVELKFLVHVNFNSFQCVFVPS
jgi:hypothetical protein